MATTSQPQSVSYQYSPLSPDQDHPIKMDTAPPVFLSGLPSAPLVGCVGCLQSTDKSETASEPRDLYDAVSYCWGSPEYLNSIEIVAMATDEDDTTVIDRSTSHWSFMAVTRRYSGEGYARVRSTMQEQEGAEGPVEEYTASYLAERFPSHSCMPILTLGHASKSTVAYTSVGRGHLGGRWKRFT
jgi:hypothetical protein